MRTRVLSRIFSQRVRSRRRACRHHLVSAIALLCFVAAASAGFQDDTAGAAQTSTPGGIAPNVPVAIEPRKLPESVPKPSSRPANIRVDKTLVLINVTVTDPLNRFVTVLEKEHF